MIIRYVANDREHLLEATVGYVVCRPDMVNAWKKRIKRAFTFEFNGLADVQFKTFKEESDYDEV